MNNEEEAKDENLNFIFYRSWFKIIEEGCETEAEQNEFLRLIIEYGLFSKKTTKHNNMMFLNQVYEQIDLAKAKYAHIKKIRSSAGKRGGAPKGNQNARKTSKTSKNNQNKRNDNDNVINKSCFLSSNEEKTTSEKNKNIKEENQKELERWKKENGI